VRLLPTRRRWLTRNFFFAWWCSRYLRI